MIVIKILLFTLLALICLALALIVSRAGISVRIKNGETKLFLHLGVLKLNAEIFFGSSEKKVRVKKENLKKFLKKSVLQPLRENTSVSYVALNQKAPHDSTSKTADNTSKSASSTAFSRDTHLHNQNTNGEKTFSKAVFEKQAQEHSTGKFLKTFTKAVKSAEPAELILLIKNTLFDLKDKLTKYARISIRRFNITVSDTDAAKTALNYGILCISYEQLLGVLDEYKNLSFKHKKCGIFYDFVAGKTKVDVDIKLTMPVYGILICIFEVYSNANNFSKRQNRKDLKKCKITQKQSKA